MIDNMLSCPFCQSVDVAVEETNDRVAENSGEYFVFCRNCKTCGPRAFLIESAISKWNARNIHE